MKNRDARSLSAEAQEVLRRRVARAVRSGMAQTEAATVFGVARGTVNKWSRRHEESGVAALKAGRRGRPPEPRLSAEDRARVVRWFVGKCPDQLRLPFALWTREAVQQLLSRRLGLEVSVWTVGRYLKPWGLTPQKPIRRVFEQDSAAVQRWLRAWPSRIRVFFLPSYSPELNPDELLNQDVKSNALGRTRPSSRYEMTHNVRGYLRVARRDAPNVKAYFHGERVCCAAA